MIKLLRAERPKPAGRVRQRVIGSFRVDEAVPVEVLEALTRDERRTLSQWLRAYHYSQRRADALAILTGPQDLDKLVAALNVAADVLQPNEADRLWHQVQAISRALKRAGHPRPERRGAAPLPGQLDLVDELEATSNAPDSPVSPSTSSDMSSASLQ
ncbi:hypothetical protein [Burkholderia alba]|uniref:hypothetical protein n=1 Tax=Burkholderia alba TaxID=2683677 RepID=UPI002B060A34|nr:hypothetical protein [Burkholderia alba]